MKVIIAPLEWRLSETESGFRAFEYEFSIYGGER